MRFEETLRVVAVGVALVVGVGLGGCYRPGGSAEEGRFGNPVRIDPCGFLAAGQVGVGVSFGPSELHECRYLVSSPEGRDAGITVSVRVESDAAAVRPSGPDVIVRQQGSLVRTARWDPGRRVWREVVHDVAHVGVTIETYGGGAEFDHSAGRLTDGVDLRGVSARVGDGIVESVLAGRVARLSFPEDSLGAVNVCGAVTSEEVGAMLGRVEGVEHVSLGSRCEWSSGATGRNSWLRVEVGLSTEEKVVAEGYRGGGATVVAGRPTVIRFGATADRDAMECAYSTSGKTWDRWTGATDRDTSVGPHRLVEVLEVQVGRSGGSDAESAEICAGLERVAAKLWSWIR